MYIINLTNGLSFKCDSFTDSLRMCDKVSEPAVIADADTGEVVAIRNVTMDTELEFADFSVRAYNCLKRAGCDTIGDVLHKYDLPLVRNLGKKSMKEIRTFANFIHQPLWCDAQTLVDLALLGLQALADLKGIDLDDNDNYCDLCERITTAHEEGWAPDMELDAADIATIKEELGL